MRRMINANSRTKKVYLNSIVALLTKILQVILGFVVRKVFINSLGVMYLGYNSVFSNILQMLNLADLGIGVAITSFLYKPLADKDNDRVCALMYMYKKVYRIIGLMVLIAGLIVLAFIEVLIPDAECSLWYLRVLFLINLSGAVSTYFFAYKRTLIIADQKSYIANATDTIMFFAISVMQIGVLVTAPNYIIYLILNIAKNITSNVILSIKSDKILGDFNADPDKSLVDEYKPQIIRYIKDVFISRIGATIFYGTDNVIISIFKGSILAGYLSNYTMITSQLTAVINQVFSAVQASYGNYINSNKSIDEQRKMTDNYFCVNFCIGNFCFVCFTLLVQPFVILLWGQEFQLNFSTAVWLGINLMLSMLIQLPSQVFTIYKLFLYDRPIIIVSALLNIVISVVLVKRLGINGVLIGTFVTSLIYLFSRFFIISRYIFNIPYAKYLRKIVVYFCISAISFTLIYFSVRNVTGETVVSFIIRMLLVMAFSILITAVGLSFTDEFKFLSKKFVPIKFRVFTKRMTLIAILFVLIIGIVIFNNMGTSDVNVNQS